MLWFYDLPNWLAGLTIVGLTVFVALLGHHVWHRISRGESTDEHRELALKIVDIGTVLLSLLIAFTSITVWEAYSQAEDAVGHEAGIAGELARDLAILGTPEALATREALRSYLHSIIDDEWPAMAAGRESEKASHAFNAVFRWAGLIEATEGRNEILLREIWKRTNELNTYRRGRLDKLEGAVSGVLWAVILAGTLVIYMLFYVQPIRRHTLASLAAYATLMGLVFFLILAMDLPFAGNVSVSPKPFETALASMRRWDGEKPSDWMPAAPK